MHRTTGLYTIVPVFITRSALRPRRGLPYCGSRLGTRQIVPPLSNFSQKRHFCAGPAGNISLSVQLVLPYIKLRQIRASPNSTSETLRTIPYICAIFRLFPFCLVLFTCVLWFFCFSFTFSHCKSLSKYFTYYIVTYPSVFSHPSY